MKKAADAIESRKTTKVLEMIRELQKRGYNVSYYARKEGGYRISKINDVSFTGSAGNVRARELLGTALTKYQEEHLKKIKTNKGTFGHRKRMETIPPEFIKRQNRINKAFREKDSKARVTRRKIRYRIREFGTDKTLEYLKHMELYVRDLVHQEALESLYLRILLDSYSYSGKALNLIEEVLKIYRAALDMDKTCSKDTYNNMKADTYSWEDFEFSTEPLTNTKIWAANMKKYLKEFKAV